MPWPLSTSRFAGVSATSPAEHSVESTLRSVIEPLAALERGAGSEGEGRAAQMLAEMLERAGARVQIDDAEFRGENYARVLVPLGFVGLLGNRLVRHGHRLTGALLNAA